jgi:hypothetical protein
MALQASQSITSAAFTTPTALTPSSSETIAEASFGQQGVAMRVITTGTLTNVSVNDPNFTASSNPGTVTPLASPASGVRMLLIPRSAIAASTGLATVLFSGALTGVTYELYRY